MLESPRRGIQDLVFEAVELGGKVSKEDYEAQLPGLRRALLGVQARLRDTASFPAVVVLSGTEGAGRGELLNRLAQWLDMRDVEVHAFDRVSDEERSRPEFWRYWRTLPARGRLSIYLNSWYTDPIFDRALEGGKRSRFQRRLGHIAKFEEMLIEDGSLLLKFWLHLSKKEQGKRLEKLAKDPATAWRVTKARQRRHEAYDKLTETAEMAIRLTDTRLAPWSLVDAKSGRHRDLSVAHALVEGLRQRLDTTVSTSPPESSPSLEVTVDLADTQPNLEAGEEVPPRSVRVHYEPDAQRTVLDTVDLDSTLDGKTYRRELDIEQERVAQLTRQAYDQSISTVLVFEGWDAAGKGGAIRRITAAIDARYTDTISISAPTSREKAQHYLWRFWRDIPRPGHVSIYDRSWYGRVLVERVEGFAKPHEWMRAYAEINAFEEQLVDHGYVLQKFFLHIDKDEQLARFEERKRIPYKRHKITAEDWRNRDKWDDYTAAINEMVARTSTPQAPWTLVAGNDKKHARVTVLKTLRRALERRLG